ncbi:hypothetical protein C5S42_02215, partial [Candidatus Methanomarinus sp.]
RLCTFAPLMMILFFAIGMVTFYLIIIKGINTEHFETAWLARFYLLHQNIPSLIR